VTIEDLIAKWLGKEGGAERINCQPFLNDLCTALGLETANTPAAANTLHDYQFEAPVRFTVAGEPERAGRIDLYRRGRFVLEAKQSRIPPAQRDRPELFDIAPAAPVAPSGARYDRLMRDAFAQAEAYARALPPDHGWPPFLLVVDIGRAIEVWFDWSGMGKGYGHFPDKSSYRIELPALRDPEIQARLRAIWNDPHSIDPRRKAADVTREVARRLAQVASWLEQSQALRTSKASAPQRSLAIEETSLFLMRILFCMFAEDIGLLPQGRFRAFLEDCIDNEALFEPGLRDIWGKMGKPHLADRYSLTLRDRLRYFNGNLFTDDRVFPLSRADRGELYQAARANWAAVEPAIFGTLLEQALVPEERARLGAHYTPRAYVERLVDATIMEVLRADWATAQTAIATAEDSGNRTAAIAAARTFQMKLADTRILDPACGTGNFLYVAMEALMRLESAVLETLATLGAPADPQVGPANMLGLELNPRAAVIAELVLWIGWLRFRLRDYPDAIPDPVLARTAQINFGRHGGYDACLALNAFGSPDLENPRPAEWPEADFIVGNPPFIGAKYMRERLSPGYAEALWKAWPAVPPSADFVMQWWSRAATELTRPGTRLRRFGFVTTNSITGAFSRRVLAFHMAGSASGGQGAATPATGTPEPGKNPVIPANAGIPSDHGTPARPLSLILAIPDHPWVKSAAASSGGAKKKGAGPAAVRIAMTVAEAGTHKGTLHEVTTEKALDTDAPQIEFRATEGTINPDLTVGTETGTARPLRANERLAYRGVQLMGAGFIVTPAEAKALGLGTRPGLESHIRDYRNGRDLLQRPRGVMVIDLFGLTEAQVRQRFPEVYQHLLATVKPERDGNNRASYRDNWWIFGEPRSDMRPALAGLPRYIATVETAKHRIFHFLDASILPDNKLIAIGSDSAFHLGVLQSRLHTEWALEVGGLLEDRPVYVKSTCFDPFPFPEATPEQAARIAEIAEELDAARKAALAENPGLTMTGLYNRVEALKAGAPLTHEARRARAAIVKILHEDLDAAVAQAYNWSPKLETPTLIANLVALNAERAADEREGQVRYLRPAYQAPAGGKAHKPGEG
jgi:hypothetical protein